MNKERLKNLILTTLIISAFFLTSQIWFNEKLWPDGYNFFDYAENLPLIGRFFHNTDNNNQGPTVVEASVAQLAVPYRAVVSNADKRELFAPNQQEFEVVTRMSFSIIDSLFSTSNPEYTPASLTDIKTALSDNSVFLTYEYDMDTSFMAGARMIPNESISKIAPAFAHIVLTHDLHSNAIVYLCSSDSNSIHRFVVKNKADAVKQITNSYARQNDNYAFAYELQLDKPETDEELEQRLYLSSFVLVNVGVDQPEKMIVASTPFAKQPDKELCDKIVASFGLEANSLRLSQSSDGTQKYIENSATITINPDGVISYTAVDNQSGLSAQSTSDKIEAILEIAIKQWGILFPDTPLSLCVAENMTEHDGSTLISFNYVVNGKPVIINYDGYKNGITARFKGDKLISADFIFCRINTLDETATPSPMLQSFDAAYEQLGITDTVTHAISCYAVNIGSQKPHTSTLAITHGDTTGVIQ